MIERQFATIGRTRQVEELWPILIGAGLIAVIAVSLVMPLSPKALAIVVGLPLMWLLIKHSEVTLALFVTSGSFKSYPLLDSLSGPVDLTLALALLLMAGILLHGRFVPTRAAWTFELFLGLLFAALIVGSLLYAPSTDYGTEKAFRFATLTMLAFVAPLLVLGSEAHVRRFLFTLVAIGAALAFSAIVGSEPQERFTALESAGTISLARFTGVAVLVLLFLLPSLRVSLPWKLAGVGLILTLLVAQLGTGSRGPFFALLGAASITTIAWLVLNTRRPALPRYAAMAAISLTLVVGLIVAWQSPIVPEQSRERIQGLSLESPTEDTSTNARVVAWSEAGEVFEDNPVFGTGVGGFSSLGIGKLLRYPHNLVLEIAAEVGLLGLTMFVLLLLMVLHKLLSLSRAIGGAPEAQFAVPLAVLALLLFSLANSMVSGDLNDARMLWLMLGVALAVVGVMRQGVDDAAAGIEHAEGSVNA